MFDFGLDDNNGPEGTGKSRKRDQSTDDIYSSLFKNSNSKSRGAGPDEVWSSMMGDMTGGAEREPRTTPGKVIRRGENVIHIQINGGKNQKENHRDDIGHYGMNDSLFTEGDKALRTKSGWQKPHPKSKPEVKRIEIIHRSGKGTVKVVSGDHLDKKHAEKMLHQSASDKITMAAGNALYSGSKKIGGTIKSKIKNRKGNNEVTFADAAK